MDVRLRFRPAPSGGRGRFVLAGVVWFVAAGVLTGCSQPPPRTFYDFLHDKISREATLTRCDRAGTASARDLECANARRAALTIELRRERALQVRYQKESEQKIAALQARIAARERAEQAAAAAANTAAGAEPSAAPAAGSSPAPAATAAAPAAATAAPVATAAAPAPTTTAPASAAAVPEQPPVAPRAAPEAAAGNGAELPGPPPAAVHDSVPASSKPEVSTAAPSSQLPPVVPPAAVPADVLPSSTGGR